MKQQSWTWWRRQLVRHTREPRSSRPSAENARLVSQISSQGNATAHETCDGRAAGGRDGFPHQHRCIFVKRRPLTGVGTQHGSAGTQHAPWRGGVRSGMGTGISSREKTAAAPSCRGRGGARPPLARAHETRGSKAQPPPAPKQRPPDGLARGAASASPPRVGATRAAAGRAPPAALRGATETAARKKTGADIAHYRPPTDPFQRPATAVVPAAAAGGRPPSPR